MLVKVVFSDFFVADLLTVPPERLLSFFFSTKRSICSDVDKFSFIYFASAAFAINCASGGCPRLPRSAFHAASLEEELEREARYFVNEPRNLRIDDAAQVIHLSSIFDWYRDDFLDWMKRTRPQMSDPDLLDYARLYLTPDSRANLDRAEDAGYQVRVIPYDWSLNDQGLR